MAKALFGYVGAVDNRSLALSGEVRRLRARVLELEGQLEQACLANEALHRSMNPVIADDLHTELLALDEPAFS